MFELDIVLTAAAALAKSGKMSLTTAMTRVGAGGVVVVLVSVALVAFRGAAVALLEVVAFNSNVALAEMFEGSAVALAVVLEAAPVVLKSSPVAFASKVVFDAVCSSRRGGGSVRSWRRRSSMDSKEITIRSSMPARDGLAAISEARKLSRLTWSIGIRRARRERSR